VTKGHVKNLQRVLTIHQRI